MKKKTGFLVLLAAMALFATAPITAQTSMVMVPDNQTSAADEDMVVVDDEASEADVTVDNAEADKDIAMVAPMPKPGVPSDNDVLARFKNMRTEIQKLIRQRFFAKAEKQLEALRDAVKSSKMADANKMSFMSSIERREKVTLFSAQGQYQKAADAIRQAISYKELKGDKERLLKVQEKVGLQKEWFDIRAKFEKQAQQLIVSKQPLLKEKLAILKQMDSKKKLSDAELKKLQVALRQVNEKLSKIRKEQQELHRVFAVKRDKMHKAGVILSAEQHRKLFPLVMKRMMARFENYNLHKQIARHLTNIAENTEVTWKDLKANFASLQKLQEEIWSLRKQLSVYADKTPLTDADYKAAREIRARLEKAVNASEKLMNKVEDAFIDTKIFGKLSAKEKLEFVKLFRDVWSRDKEFESLKPALEDLFNKIFDGGVIGGPAPVEPDPTPMPKPEPIGANIEGNGYIIQEGNIFLLRFGDKILYPNNLPARYMVNKLEVKFAADFILRAMPMDTPTNELPKVDGPTNQLPREEWWKKYPEIRFTYVHAPQMPDEPFERPVDMATPTEVIEDNINNDNRPSNLMNAF